jgi:hypothetical protein
VKKPSKRENIVAAWRRSESVSVIGNGMHIYWHHGKLAAARMSASASGESCSVEKLAQLWRKLAAWLLANVARGAAISRSSGGAMALGENGGSAGGISSGIGGWQLQRRHRLSLNIHLARINENGEILAIFSENMAGWRHVMA